MNGRGNFHNMRKVERSISHMSQHLNQSLRISTMSAIAGVSTSHFFGLFKSITGFTPMGYFIRLRMLYACELLGNRTLSIKQIATLLGYDDPCYFSRVFKNITGFAPRNYREKLFDTADRPDFWRTDIGREPVDPPSCLRAAIARGSKDLDECEEPWQRNLRPIAAASLPTK